MERGDEMSIPKIAINREQAEWVHIEGTGKRIALYEDDEFVTCVESGGEERFKRGEPFRRTSWAKGTYTFTFTGAKVSLVRSKMRLSTIEEIALEVQMNCNEQKFCWRAKYGSYCVYRPEINTTDTATSYQKALRSSDKDETPLADLKWGEFMTEEKQ